MNRHLATVQNFNEPTKRYLQPSFDGHTPTPPLCDYILVFGNCPVFTAFYSIQWSHDYNLQCFFLQASVYFYFLAKKVHCGFA